MQKKNWCVYLVECLDGSYYTGITNDIRKRMKAHKSRKGSKYVKSKGFGRLICSKNYPNKSEVLKAEYHIKKLSKNEKLNFFIS
ncbi:MAG: GIY-YIG nuclease family protein [Nanoarchaeota archaeon]